MKKILLCALLLGVLGLSGCQDTIDVNVPESTQPPTQMQTEPPTLPPTQPPTLPPTQPPTEPPTQWQEIVEDGTFSTIIEEPVTSPPSEIPTQIPTQIPTIDSTEATSSAVNTENEIIAGSWKLVYYNRSGRHISPRTSITYTFNTDGTFTLVNQGIEMTGRYSFNGKTLSYVSDVNGEIGNFDFNEEEDILTDTDSGNVAVFMRTE